MTSVEIETPDSLLRREKKIAESEGLTLDQFIAMALSGQLSSWDTAREFEGRANQGSWERMQELLSKAPDVKPEYYDKLT